MSYRSFPARRVSSSMSLHVAIPLPTRARRLVRKTSVLVLHGAAAIEVPHERDDHGAHFRVIGDDVDGDTVGLQDREARRAHSCDDGTAVEGVDEVVRGT